MSAPSQAAADFEPFVKRGEDGIATLHLMVDGVHCGNCIRRIERGLDGVPGVVSARLNLTTRRLVVTWRESETDAGALVGTLARLGYGARPFDPDRLGADTARRERALLRAMAVAGFAAANVMLLSISVWAGERQGMGPATRDLMHWLSALIALPAIAYAGQPFFRSALGALMARRANMDVPISLAVLLAAGASLVQTVNGAPDAYFDSAVTLLFFLLIGRYLDSRARGKARSAAEHLMALGAGTVTVIDASGQAQARRPDSVAPGEIVLIAAGERVAVDGRLIAGESEIDTSLITGESLPRVAAPGETVFAGTLNLAAPIRIEVTAAGDETLLAEIVRLMEAAEQGRAKQVLLAEKITRIYVPAVHGLAAATFIGWLAIMGVGWQAALMNAVAVLVITCPCALALAVPVVQVIASGRLMRRGILVKSATALERIATVDTIVFDKTGTLTEGRLELAGGDYDADDLARAASLAAASTHPLARALVHAASGEGGKIALADGVREQPGQGLGLDGEAGETRLGNRRWCGVDREDDATEPELWLRRPGRAPVRFAFRDRPRADAAEVIAFLRRAGFRVELVSGDRAPAVAAAAEALGIETWRAEQTPAGKCARLDALAASGHRVLMVGDGLNDAPALAAAQASMSPASAADVSQTAADIVFQGERLGPLLDALAVAHRADRLVRQNFGLAFAYNAITVPLAVFGMVTPLVAAVSMSASSLIVTLNALRLNRGGKR